MDRGSDPGSAPGNASLLQAFDAHASHTSSDRSASVPILLFLAPKSGQVRFEGLAVVERASVISQRDPRTQRSFGNLVYGLMVLELAEENEQLDWAWIDARCDAALSTGETNAIAPAS